MKRDGIVCPGILVFLLFLAAAGCAHSAHSQRSSGASPEVADPVEVADAEGGARLRQRLQDRRERRNAEAAGETDGTAGTARRRTLTVDGRERRYLLLIPASATAARKAPMVIALHGSLGADEPFAQVTGWFEKGQREGFIVAIPNGTPKIGSRNVWNAGSCCSPANDQGVNDVAFLSAIIDDVQSLEVLDESRVYVTGFSNGAMMTHRAGCQLSQRLAAIAAVSGTLGIPACQPSAPIAVMQLHGSADSKVPLQGIRRRNADFTFGSVYDTIAAWRQAERCGPETRRFQPAAGVQCEEALGCRADSTVLLCVVSGLDHVWAGGSKDSSGAFSATDFIWSFFEPRSKR